MFWLMYFFSKEKSSPKQGESKSFGSRLFDGGEK